MRKGLCYPLVLLALGGTSCGSNGLYPVSGKVTCRGEPAVGATVFFLRRDVAPLDEQSIMGVVRPDGSFTVVCDARGEGAPPGEYHVLVKWPQSSAAGLSRKVPDRLRGRYADPRRPPFHATVKAEANDLPPFKIKD